MYKYLSLIFLTLFIVSIYAEEASFESADADKNGTISQEEFQRFLTSYSEPKKNTAPPVPTKKTEFSLADKNRDGSVSEKEFIDFINAATTPPPTSQWDDQTDFAKADLNKDGFVSPDELALYSQNVQKNLSKNADGAFRSISDKTVQEIPRFEYAGPMKMIANKNGTKIYVVCHDAGEIAVIETKENKVIQTFPVGVEPDGIALSSDEKTIFVTFGGHQGCLAALDAETGKVIQTVSAGHTPLAPVLTPDETKLFLCNRFNNDIAQYELPAMKLVKRIKVIREPFAAAVTKNGKYLIVLNSLPNAPNCYLDQPTKELIVAAEVSVIDVITGTVKSLHLPNGSCNLRDICFSPDGRYVYLTHLISHFMNGTDKLDYGQMNVNAMSILDTTQFGTEKNGEMSGYVNTVLLDDPELGAANPWGITTSDDGKKIFVAISGTNELIVLDAEILHKKLATTEDASKDLAFTTELKKRITFKGKGAREILAIGQTVYIGLYYSDLILKYDFVTNEAPQILSMNSQLLLSQERIGEIAWNDASLCHQQWQTCGSCHPEARMTGMNWDLLHDGAGNPKNTKSMIRSYETPPAMWLGDRFAVRQCTRTGFQFIMFAPPLSEPCDCIDSYLRVLPPIPSPYLVNGQLSEKAERGKKIFEAPTIGCLFCHPEPYFTDKKMYDVKTQVPSYERRGRFDTPTLIEVWRTAPYLHDGRYVEMKELFKSGKHGDVKGTVDELTDEQLDDLVEYVLSL